MQTKKSQESQRLISGLWTNILHFPVNSAEKLNEPIATEKHIVFSPVS